MVGETGIPGAATARVVEAEGPRKRRHSGAQVPDLGGPGAAQVGPRAKFVALGGGRRAALRPFRPLSLQVPRSPLRAPRRLPVRGPAPERRMQCPGVPHLVSDRPAPRRDRAREGKRPRGKARGPGRRFGRPPSTLPPSPVLADKAPAPAPLSPGDTWRGDVGPHSGAGAEARGRLAAERKVGAACRCPSR